MELKDTIKNMLSDKWEDRLVAEYDQVAIRINNLAKYVQSKDYKVPSILIEQLNTMCDYYHKLWKRVIVINDEIAYRDTNFNKLVEYVKDVIENYNATIILTWED